MEIERSYELKPTSVCFRIFLGTEREETREVYEELEMKDVLTLADKEGNFTLSHDESSGKDEVPSRVIHLAVQGEFGDICSQVYVNRGEVIPFQKYERMRRPWPTIPVTDRVTLG